MAKRNPHSYTGSRQLAQPGRNLFLDRSEKGPHAQRFLISAGTPTAPACLSVPLRALGIALQLDLHSPRSQYSSGQNRPQTASSRSLTEYVTVIPNVSTKLGGVSVSVVGVGAGAGESGAKRKFRRNVRRASSPVISSL